MINISRKCILNPLAGCACRAYIPGLKAEALRAFLVNETKHVLENDPKRARQIIANLMGEIRVSETDDAVMAEFDNASGKLLLASNSQWSTKMVAWAGFIFDRQSCNIAKRRSKTAENHAGMVKTPADR